MKNTPEVLHFITNFARPDSVVETRNGPMAYLDWLERVEIPRIRAKQHAWPVAVYTNPTTKEVALAHLRAPRVKARTGSILRRS